MDFDAAVALAEEINREPCWTAEVEATGEIDAGIYVHLVAARFERVGLIYNVEIEAVWQWPAIRQQLQQWEVKQGLRG